MKFDTYGPLKVIACNLAQYQINIYDNVEVDMSIW